MRPLIYEEFDLPGKRAAIIRLMTDDDGNAALFCLDSNYVPVCKLIVFVTDNVDGSYAAVVCGAKDKLESYGINTTFCQWGNEGEIIFLEKTWVMT